MGPRVPHGGGGSLDWQHLHATTSWPEREGNLTLAYGRPFNIIHGDHFDSTDVLSYSTWCKPLAALYTANQG